MSAQPSTLDRRAASLSARQSASSAKPLPFAKPANWDKFSPIERRAYQLQMQDVDTRMTTLLHGLPAATPGNRAKIESELEKLEPHERQRFDEVLRAELAQRAGGVAR